MSATSLREALDAHVQAVQARLARQAKPLLDRIEQISGIELPEGPDLDSMVVRYAEGDELVMGEIRSARHAYDTQVAEDQVRQAAIRYLHGKVDEITHSETARLNALHRVTVTLTNTGLACMEMQSRGRDTSGHLAALAQAVDRLEQLAQGDKGLVKEADRYAKEVANAIRVAA